MSAADDINAQIIQAAHDSLSDDGGITLGELFTKVIEGSGAADLDPLIALSVTLPLSDPGAQKWIEFMGENCSAKEVVMAIQEELEKIEEKAEADSDDEDEGEGEVKVVTRKVSLVQRLIRLFILGHRAIGRLEMRRRTASEMLQPILSNFRGTLLAISSRVKSTEGGNLLSQIERFTESVLSWVKALRSITPEEVAKCQLEVKSLDDCALTVLRPTLQCDTAQRALEICFPRLRVTAKRSSFCEVPDALVILKFQARYSADPAKKPAASPSIVSVVLLVHAWLSSKSSEPSLPPSVLPSFLSSLLAMLQPDSNFHDDALAFLLIFLHHNRTSTRTELSPDTALALLPPLTILSSAHPSPSIRHQGFRTVSLLLANVPSQLHFQLLADLVANSEYPQMRVAVVGLVKDAVLEALDPSQKDVRNIFASPEFMRAFGPLLFRPSPSDLFNVVTKSSLETFLESPEPKRLTEVLSLYYVILLRDSENKTGIRKDDMLSTVDKSLLNPLSRWLEDVMNKEFFSGCSEHAMMSLVSLQMGLDRITEARTTI